MPSANKSPWRHLAWINRERILMVSEYSRSLTKATFRRKPFRAVRSYCIFIGYPRSGHSLVGSLLDAHPNIVIAHELDALKYMNAGFSRGQILNLIVDRSRIFTKQGRVWTGYSYRVPGQWQGNHRDLRVIGDKNGWEIDTFLR
jgi:hypothetical protein